MTRRTFLLTGASRGIGRPLSTRLAADIALLLSDDAGFITGQTLLVEGGASIGKASL